MLGTQAVAVSKVHAGKGFSNMAGGWELNLAPMAMALGVLVAGPGRVSVHELLEHRLERASVGRWLRPRRSRRALAAVKAIE